MLGKKTQGIDVIDSMSEILKSDSFKETIPSDFWISLLIFSKSNFRLFSKLYVIIYSLFNIESILLSLSIIVNLFSIASVNSFGKWTGCFFKSS